MGNTSINRRTLIAGLVFFLCGAVLSVTGDTALAQKKFARKECLDCHTKFASKYFSMKDVHPVVKEKKCEDCHLRHGIIPKLILKKEGNDLCFACHGKEKIGMNKPSVHTALKTGKCTLCHNPHASQAPHLLDRKSTP